MTLQAQARHRLLIATSLLTLAGPAPASDACGAAACTAEQLSRCRQANDMALEQARQLPATRKADIERKAALVSQVQALLTKNRKDRVNECTTWARLGQVASRQ